mmetsp:Transcript_25296/g.64299  ORF Transcript_25296/g.64299 Transcript_25296/m.64299 type:complete len:127 (+) Transcript_25296:486-866(+)
MRENLHLFDFELSPAELAQIDSLDGVDPRSVARAPRPADAPVEITFANALDEAALLRWGDATVPGWTLSSRGTLQLQSYSGAIFSAAAASDPAQTLWRWSVPASEGGEDYGARMAVTIVPLAKTEL